MVSFKQLEFMALLEPNWQELDLLDSEYLQSLHPVFNTVLDTFPDITGATVQGQIRLWEVLQSIKYNLGQDIDASTYLLNKYVAGVLNDDYDQKKKQLPAICYNARFKGYKDLEHLKSPTNLMFLDIDDFDSREMALEYKQEIIEKYDWIIACNLSLSKLGLHVIVMVDKISDNDDYNLKYKYISKKYFEGRLDEKCLSLTRFTVVPYDFNIYINESPVILDIDSIIKNDKKGMSSAYNCDTTSSVNTSPKGMSSAYNCVDSSHISSNQKGMRSAYKEEEKIICTEHTFLRNTSLEQILSNAAREKGLRFRQEADESLIQDVDIPLYYNNGIDVIEVNLHCYKKNKVKSGSRTFFIGALTIQMIYLNIESPDNIDQKIRKEIFKFILNVNNKHCAPPLTKSEVMKSFNANFKKYQSGEIDFTPYLIKQRAFWSKHTTLKGNEKRKVTCRIKNRPIVEESKQKIYEAIEILTGGNDKITQGQVSRLSGLSISTVKKYWKEFKEVVRTNNLLLKNRTEMKTESKETSELQEEIEFDDDAMDVGKEILENPENILNCDPETQAIENISLSDEQQKQIFNRVYSHLLPVFKDDEVKERLYNKYLSKMDEYNSKEKKILCMNPETITDGVIFAKQFSLESQLQNLCIEFYNGV